MPILMSFGDSNTHGTPPITQRGVYARYDAATRWPTRAAALLGEMGFGRGRAAGPHNLF